MNFRHQIVGDCWRHRHFTGGAITMLSTNRKTGEMGQRNPRNRDASQKNGDVMGNADSSCGALFSNKYSHSEERGTDQNEGHWLVCPVCRRIADRSPAGIVILNGGFYAAHKTEILKQIHKTALDAVMKNPLGRAMDIHIYKGKDSVTITTTDVNLAQKIRGEVFKSYGGGST